jgi:PIN domain nuclease of toxin-antitoxin system
MTIRVVADTHAILWYLYDDARLSPTAGALLDEISAHGDQIAISAIVLVEVVYLIEKGRIESGAYDRILAALQREDATLVEIPIDQLVVQAMRQVERDDIPDMPDRIVAATGVYLGVPIVSRDRKIRAANITTIW